MLHKDREEESEEFLDDELLLDDHITETPDILDDTDRQDLPVQSSDVEKVTDVYVDDNDDNDDNAENDENDDNADNDDDFYNDDDYEEEVKPAPKPKQPKPDPEDPDYWLDEQSEFDHIIPKPKKIWIWWTAAVVALLALLIGTGVWFFRPYVDDAVKYGYIKNMERRGTFVKTFEGVLIPYRELGDDTPTYFEEIPFSVDGDSLATQMKRMMLDNIPVRLEYELYHRPLLWKGSSPMVIVGVDTADVRKILPPEYQ